MWLSAALWESGAGPTSFSFGDFVRIPIEMLVLVAVALFLPPWPRRIVAIVAGILFSLLLFDKFLNMGYYDLLNRAFNPVTDWGQISQAKGDSLQDLPLFENLLGRYRSRAFLDIELKVPGLEETILAALRRFRPERGFIVSSFLPQVLQEMNARDAAIPLGIICDRREQLLGWRQLPITHVIPHQSLTSRELVEEVHTAAKQLFVWTVNRAEDMVRLAQWGADAIISDDTELLVHNLGKTN